MADWNFRLGSWSVGPATGSAPPAAASTGGTGSLLGTNQLQASIDKFAKSVDKLDLLLAKVNGLGGNPSGNGGSNNSSKTPTQHNMAGRLQTPMGYLKDWATGQTFGESPQKQSRPANGGGTTVPAFRSQTSHGNGGGNGRSGGGQPSGGIVAGGMMIGSALAGYGKSQLPTQVGMSSFVQTARLSMNPGLSATAAGNQIRYAAFGGGNRNLNGLAMGPQDAIAGQQLVNYVAGTGAVQPGTASSYGRGALGASAMFGLSNQGMSYAQSAGLMAQMYSPGTSTKFLQYGFNVTPRMLGGGLRNSAQVAQGMVQGFYGKNKVNPQELAFSLREGGNAQTTLQSMFGAQSGDYANMLQAENTVAWKSGMNPGQINSLFSHAARGTPGQMHSAQAQLQKYGLNTSDIQSIKNLQSVKTGRSSDVADSFNAGLNASIGLLTQFNVILTKIIDIPGINQLVGGAGGFAGGLSSLTSAGTMGMGMAGGSMILKRLLAGRAAGTAATAATGDAALVAGEGGAAAGGAGLLGALGPVAAGLGAGALLGKLSPHHDPTKPNFLWSNAEGPGGSKSGWNSFSGAGKNLRNWLWNDPENFFKGGNNQPNTPGGSAAAGHGGGASTSTKISGGGGVSRAAAQAVGSAEQELGRPYVWGGDSPKVGFDCSGLVEWAYHTAGISLPRTSQAQWAFLNRGHSVATDKVIEGDIVFQAGSDGTEENPGHEAMMINGKQIIEAPQTGMDVRIRAYNPREWQHAGRPTTGTGGASSSAGTSTSVTSSGSGTGNSGLGMGSGSYGSSDELSNLTSALLGGAGGISTGFPSGGAQGPSPAAGSSSAGSTAGITGGGSPAANRVLMQKLAASFGWASGPQWSSLDALEMSEAGYDNKIWNQQGSGAYGIPQADPASKLPLAGRPPSEGGRSDPKTQELWMLDYVKGRYDDPVKAWAFHRANNSYAEGTPSALPGWSWTGERGPELRYEPGGAAILPASLSDHLARQSAKRPAEGPWRANLPAMGSAAGGCTGHDVKVELVMAAGAVQISGAGLGSTSLASKAANEIISQVVRRLADQQVLAQIAAGDHHGN